MVQTVRREVEKMKLEDMLDLVAPDVPITICEANGRMRYVGAVPGAHQFDTWELAQISASAGRLVLIVASNDTF